jgi:hypothetical protein
MIGMHAQEQGGRIAYISTCKKFRYMLRHRLQGYGKPFMLCMLNPSTADATQDDPTIRRCLGFARREEAQVLFVVNIYALRATSPDELRKVMDPVGPANNDILGEFARRAKEVNTPIVCAWGSNVPHVERAQQVVRMFHAVGAEMVCFGKNKDGSPKHPLYLRSDAPLVPFYQG